MNPIDEALVATFYSHKLHVEDACTNPLCTSEAMMKTCDDLIHILLNTDCDDLIKVIRKYGISFTIDKSDIPQYSSLEDCVYQVPEIVQDCGIENISYTQMGFMLRVKPRKDGADSKYGENHAKTASQMGLCAVEKCSISSSYLGISYNKRTRTEQENLVPKLVLFIPLICNLFASNASYIDVNESLSILKESTQKRRLPNVWRLINKVNKVLPNEFQIIRY